MISGVVTAYRQAIIRLTVHGPEGQKQEIEAVIDTGFDGTLTLPPATPPHLACGGVGADVRRWQTGAKAFSISK
jgi:hypothetical protein